MPTPTPTPLVIVQCGAIALVAAGLLLPISPRARSTFVSVLAVSALLAWMVARNRIEIVQGREETQRREARIGSYVASTRQRAGAAASPIDPESYPLRVPHDDTKSATAAATRAVEAGIVPRKLLALAKRVHNPAAARRLVAATSDVHARCRFLDRTLEKHADASIPRVIQIRAAHEIGRIHASRRAAMDAVQELTMRLPGGEIARSYAKVARELSAEMHGRVQETCKRWDWCMSARIASAMNACDHRGSPTPFDPKRSSMLYP